MFSRALRVSVGRCTLAVVIGAALPIVICRAASDVPPATSSSTREKSLRRFLEGYASKHELDQENDKETRYLRAFVDLNGDGKPEALVYLVSEGWCGSGGCPTLVLTPRGNSYRLITRIFITRPPIMVLTGKSNGWRNLGVWVQGGGIQPGYEAELRFDGKRYPLNPSVAPARPLRHKSGGEVVISSAKNGKLLYPTSDLKLTQGEVELLVTNVPVALKVRSLGGCLSADYWTDGSGSATVQLRNMCPRSGMGLVGNFEVDLRSGRIWNDIDRIEEVDSAHLRSLRAKLLESKRAGPQR